MLTITMYMIFNCLLIWVQKCVQVKKFIVVFIKFHLFLFFVKLKFNVIADNNDNSDVKNDNNKYYRI